MLESKRRAIIFFILSLLLALTAGFLVLNKVKALNSDLGTMVRIYVAKQNISSRTVITPNDVKREEIPKKFLRDYHITEQEDLINKVSVVPLSTGDMITKNILKMSSSVVEENNRLITMMQSDRVFFDEPLETLDRVDIIVSHNFEGSNKTKVFMTDVKVARVAKEKSEFKGVQLEVHLDAVPDLIHMQNYADSVRVVKANVGKQGEKKQEQTNIDENTTSASSKSVTNKPVVDEPAKQEKTVTNKQSATTKSTEEQPTTTKPSNSNGD